MNTATFRSRARYWWRKEIRWWLVIGLVIFSLRSSLADWSDVPTGSMKPTILEGDRVFVNKLAYDLKVPFTTRHLANWSNPHRGDVVVFFSPHDGTRLVKRVVGLPGDTIELHNDGLVLNGQAVEYKPIAEELVRGVAPADRARQVYAAEQLPGQPHDEGELLDRGDDDPGPLLEGVVQLRRVLVDPLDHPLLVLELVDRVLQLLVEDLPVGDDHHGVEDGLVVRAV